MNLISNSLFRFTLLLNILFFTFSCTAENEAKPTIVEMQTSKGMIKIMLYDKTPLHKANFIKLVQDGFYEGVTFHRVIKDFMAQTGDPNSRNKEYSGTLGETSEGETIPAEIVSEYFHKKGALAAARMGDNVNPEKKSSGSQFYLVQGKKYSANQLTQIEARINQQNENALIGSFLKKTENIHYVNKIKSCQQNRQTDSLNILYQEIKSLVMNEENNKFSFSTAAVIAYETVGGTPFLDNGYTVFGEVIEGLEIIDEICAVTTGPRDKPTEPITIISISIK